MTPKIAGIKAVIEGVSEEKYPHKLIKIKSKEFISEVLWAFIFNILLFILNIQKNFIVKAFSYYWKNNHQKIIYKNDVINIIEIAETLKTGDVSKSFL